MANNANAGLAIAGNFAGGARRAAIGAGATVTATAISVHADSQQSFTASAVSGAGGVGAGVAGAVAINAGANTTQAQIDNGAVLTAADDISIIADSQLNGITLAGGAALGLGVGVGASIGGTLIQDLTQASIGNAQVDAGQGITVWASADQDISSVAIAGSGAGLATVAGSVTLDMLVATTEAFTDVGAQLNQTLPLNPGQTIAIRAENNTTLQGGAGALSNALIAKGSASLNASVVQKNTRAVLGGQVSSGGNIFVEALSTEDIASVSGAPGLGGGVDIAGSGGVHRINGVTQAFVDSGAVVSADGSVVIAADNASEMDITAGSISGALGAAAGASLAVGWVDKVTEAFIAEADPTRNGPFNLGGTLGAASVQAQGLLPPVTANTGDITIGFEPQGTDIEEVNAPPTNLANVINTVVNTLAGDSIVDTLLADLFGLDGGIDEPEEDPSLSQQRTADLETSLFQGIAITATSQDDVETLGRGGAVAAGLSPELSGSSAVVTNQTSAFVAQGAQATSAEAIRVAAGSDTYHLGIAGAAGLGGVVSAGASATASLIDNQTQAYIAGQATADTHIEVLANAHEDILATTAGLSASNETFGADLTASLPLISINSATHAFVDANGSIDANGNVLIAANDDTDTDVFAGQASLGSSIGLGVGGSVAVTLIDKDTQAWIGQGATVNARGDVAGTLNVFEGSVSADSGFLIEQIQGVGVQATSSENLFSLAAAGQGGSGIAFTGSLGFTVLDSDTAAYVDTGAIVTAENVNVSAVNDARTFGIAANLLIADGALGIAGGIDVGSDA